MTRGIIVERHSLNVALLLHCSKSIYCRNEENNRLLSKLQSMARGVVPVQHHTSHDIELASMSVSASGPVRWKSLVFGVSKMFL
jgi:hypothetical protein